MSRPQFVLPPGTVELVSKAQDGDLAALGQLYGITAALLTSPSTPEPLRSFMPDLLQNISAHLQSTPKDGDFRTDTLKAIAPFRRHGRPRSNPAYQARDEALGVAVYFARRSRKNLEDSCAAVEEATGVKFDVVKRAYQAMQRAGRFKN